MEIKEQLRKKVARSGNSGAVWVPKDWLGEEILITRLETKKSLEEEILKILLPYLKNISSIFLYGSYARKEETKDSDVDILVIAENKFKIKADKFDINVIQADNIEESVRTNAFIYAVILESKPIVNSYLLTNLKKIKFNSKDFVKFYIDSTKDSILSTKEMIELDRLDGEYITSYSIIYSLILRLRGIFLINCILKNKTFSNALFKEYLTKHTQEFKKIYDIYRGIRDNKTINTQIEINSAELLLNLLNKEIRALHDK